MSQAVGKFPAVDVKKAKTVIFSLVVGIDKKKRVMAMASSAEDVIGTNH